jgi:hypothetical protein
MHATGSYEGDVDVEDIFDTTHIQSRSKQCNRKAVGMLLNRLEDSLRSIASVDRFVANRK